jgi:hypothetical protein
MMENERAKAPHGPEEFLRVTETRQYVLVSLDDIVFGPVAHDSLESFSPESGV